MAKKQNISLILMTHCKVNMLCDDEKIRLRYIKIPNSDFGTWHIDGIDTGLQVSGLIKMLREKYTKLKVVYKKQF